MQARRDSHFFTPPDPRIVKLLAPLEAVCLTAAGAVAATVLLAWAVPAVKTPLPDWWSLMHPVTALAVLLAVAGLVVSARPGRRRRSAGRVLAAGVAGAGLLALAAPHSGFVLAGEQVLRAPASGGVAAQSAACLVLLGVAAALLRVRSRALTLLGDVLTVALFVAVLVVGAGWSFGAADLVGSAPQARTEPHTLLCFVLLGLVVAVRRTDHGIFSVFVGTGSGGHLARVALPFGILVPLVVAGGTYLVATHQWVEASYAAALITVFTAVALVGFLLVQAARSNTLERELRSLSLTDELTALYNRRAFFLLGEHAMLEAHRERAPVTVLFFDLDGLKTVNDTLGHKAGSDLICAFAGMLRSTVRANDVAARIGGDEFAVVTVGDHGDGAAMLARMARVTREHNEHRHGARRLRYSAGLATGNPTDTAALELLIARADADMYAHKKHKAAMQAQAQTRIIHLGSRARRAAGPEAQRHSEAS